MSTNEHEYPAILEVPAIYFRYNISPISVKYTQFRRHSFHFFVNLCAIVGGVFTVLGMLDSLINKCIGEN